MTDKKLQSRILSVAFWLIVISWFYIPFAALYTHVSYYLGNGVISLLNFGALTLSIVGLSMKSTRTGWFAISLILSLITLLYGIIDIGFPIQS